jgi:hypothetical protein
METQSAEKIEEDECGIDTLPLKNLILRNSNNFVFLVPCTLRYSQLLIAKKKAPIKRVQRALSKSDRAS